MCANEGKQAAEALSSFKKKPGKRSVLVADKHQADEKEPDEGTVLTGYSGSLTTH